ncbi:MAG: hypothetical protein JOY62_04965 [Acidobacteriaceae bacterium]|nr:hypothetical protein [Acidobacteriaceae bacterium]MBV9779306.1 hypothetical protein [Acidobacteriaceae bacterium]
MSSQEPPSSTSPRKGIPAGTNRRFEYLRRPFDANVENVGPYFQGHDVEAIYKRLVTAKDALKKEEFETAAEFEKRKETTASRPILGSLTTSSTFAFRLPMASEGSTDGWTAEYDADGQAWTIAVEPSHTTFVESDRRELDTLNLKETLLSNRNYAGTNAFGARRNVESVSIEVYGVAFRPLSKLTIEYGGAPMPPATAKQLKPHLRGLLVCTLEEPVLLRHFHGHVPTIDDPFESVTEEKYLNIQLQQFWVFDAQSGRVLIKLKPTSGVPTEP